MAATIIVEDGTGKPDANSYVTLAEATAFFDTHPQGAAFTAATTDLKNRLLITATRYLDAMVDFYGFKAQPAQALQWPRILARDRNQYGGAYYHTPDSYLAQFWDSATVPKPVKDAVLELARFMVDTTDDRAGDAPGKGIDELAIAETIRIKFSKLDQRRILPDVVMNIVSMVGVARGGSGGNVRVERA